MEHVTCCHILSIVVLSPKLLLRTKSPAFQGSPALNTTYLDQVLGYDTPINR